MKMKNRRAAESTFKVVFFTSQSIIVSSPLLRPNSYNIFTDACSVDARYKFDRGALEYTNVNVSLLMFQGYAGKTRR